MVPPVGAVPPVPDGSYGRAQIHADFCADVLRNVTTDFDFLLLPFDLTFHPHPFLIHPYLIGLQEIAFPAGVIAVLHHELVTVQRADDISNGIYITTRKVAAGVGTFIVECENGIVMAGEAENLATHFTGDQVGLE